MLVFYDYEVFERDWLCVIISPSEDEVYRVHNDEDTLHVLYEKYKDAIWVGYNNRHYDKWIQQTILSGFNPKLMNDWLIDGHNGWDYARQLNDYPFVNYDVALQYHSLKELEGFQGHNIKETGVSFNIRRALTEEEVAETFKYCENDVLETMEIFRLTYNEFEALTWLIKTFNFPLSYYSKTKAQICAEIIGCERRTFNDEWDIKPLSCIDIGKYEQVKDWFLNVMDYKKKLDCDIAGVPHTFGFGGVHGAIKNYSHVCKKDELILHVDVASYYPRLMIYHGLLTRASTRPKRFKWVFDERMRRKAAGDKKGQAPLKIVINGGFGISKDPKSKAYDPRNANTVCINGQLMLVDLIDKLENSVPSFELIQSNTDGLIIKIKKADFDLVDDVCYEWESRCNMVLEFDYIERIYQKDVNNYIFRFTNGKLERKGKWTKEKSILDNDMAILNEALCAKLIDNVPIEKTIKGCDDLSKFQRIFKTGDKFKCVVLNVNGKDYETDNKCNRVFAVKTKGGTVYKVKESGRRDKVGETSRCSIIFNDDLSGVRPQDIDLDKQWYINECNKRYREFMKAEGVA